MPVTVTVAEALGRLSLLQADAVNRAQFVIDHLTRPAGLEDPVPGGSTPAVEAAFADFHALTRRMTDLLTVIGRADADTSLTLATAVDGNPAQISKSVSAWLGWLKVVAEPTLRFYQGLAATLRADRLAVRDGVHLVPTMPETDVADRRAVLVRLMTDLNLAIAKSNQTVTVMVAE